MTIVVNASVALKWVIEEDGSKAAGELLLEKPLAAPNLLMAECANVLWAKARREYSRAISPERLLLQSKPPGSNYCLRVAVSPPPSHRLRPRSEVLR
jgi:predicted nucleic acid-binding protein